MNLTRWSMLSDSPYSMFFQETHQEINQTIGTSRSGRFHNSILWPNQPPVVPRRWSAIGLFAPQKKRWESIEGNLGEGNVGIEMSKHSNFVKI